MDQPNKVTLKPGMFTYSVGKVSYSLTGWRLVGDMPAIPKAVVIVAHHTSNWDFPIGLMASYLTRRHYFWIGKHTLFKGVSGTFMRWLGGIPINRSATKNVVEQCAQMFREREELLLVIAPEGTRKKTDHWKSGFYRIATAASVPIACAYLDFRKKTCGIGEILTPTGDMKADMDKIRAFYRSKVARFPEQAGDVRLLAEDDDNAS